MTHARQQIRDAVATAVTGLATTGANVFKSRVNPLPDTKLPGLCVYTNDEDSEPATINPPRTLHRMVTVVVQAYVKAVASWDNTADTIAAEVEAAVYANSALQALVKDIYLQATEKEFNADGEKPVAIMTLNFRATYHVLENDPETLT